MYIDLKMMWVSQFAIIAQKTLNKSNAQIAEQEKIEVELEKMENLLRLVNNDEAIEAQ